MLRQSFRRSMRRIQLAVSAVGASQGASGGEQSAERAPAPSPSPSPAPPDYAAVLVEISQASLQDVTIVVEGEPDPRPTPQEESRLGAVQRVVPALAVEQPLEAGHVPGAELAPGAGPSGAVSPEDPFQRPAPTLTHQRTHSSSANLTAADVASILRCSVRRGAAPAKNTASRSQSMCTSRPKKLHSVPGGVAALGSGGCGGSPSARPSAQQQTPEDGGEASYTPSDSMA